MPYLATYLCRLEESPHCHTRFLCVRKKWGPPVNLGLSGCLKGDVDAFEQPGVGCLKQPLGPRSYNSRSAPQRKLQLGGRRRTRALRPRRSLACGIQKSVRHSPREEPSEGAQTVCGTPEALFSQKASNNGRSHLQRRSRSPLIRSERDL